MKAIDQKNYDKKGKEVGSILCALHEFATTAQQKTTIELQLIRHTYDKLYPE